MQSATLETIARARERQRPALRHSGVNVMPTDLRLSDVSLFLAAHHAKSVSAAARSLKVTPSAVSKAIGRVEAFVGRELLGRGPRGVSVTLEGLRAIPMLEELTRIAQACRPHSPAKPIIRLAVDDELAEWAAGIVSRSSPGDVAVFTMSAEYMFSKAAEGAIDAWLGYADATVPTEFSMRDLGLAARGLFGRPSFVEQLGTGGTHDCRNILENASFVQVVAPGPDLRVGDERLRSGHITSSLSLAFAIAETCDALVDAPWVAATTRIGRGMLRCVSSAKARVAQRVALSVHQGRVRASTERRLGELVSAELRRAEAASR